MSIADFALLIFALCKTFNGSVTSWIRTIKRDKAVGGVTITRRHTTGKAVDIVLDDPRQNPAFVAAAIAMGLRAVIESDHIHVEATL